MALGSAAVLVEDMGASHGAGGDMVDSEGGIVDGEVG